MTWRIPIVFTLIFLLAAPEAYAGGRSRERHEQRQMQKTQRRMRKQQRQMQKQQRTQRRTEKQQRRMRPQGVRFNPSVPVPPQRSFPLQPDHSQPEQFDPETPHQLPLPLQLPSQNRSNLSQSRPQADSPPANNRLEQRVSFDYPYGRQNPNSHKVMVKFTVPANQLADIKDPYILVEYFDTKHDRQMMTRLLPLRTDAAGNILFELDDLNSESVYKMKVSIAGVNPNSSQHGAYKLSVGEYWGVTAGESKLARARFNFVSTLLVEANDWKLGRKNANNVDYTGNAGGWCGELPYWAAKRYLQVFSENPDQDYKRLGKFLDGSQLKNTALQEPVAGTFAWWKNNGNYHKMTILGYSLDSDTVYTLEGNFGGGIAITTRRPSEIGYIGVMRPQMLWG